MSGQGIAAILDRGGNAPNGGFLQDARDFTAGAAPAFVESAISAFMIATVVVAAGATLPVTISIGLIGFALGAAVSSVLNTKANYDAKLIPRSQAMREYGSIFGNLVGGLVGGAAGGAVGGAGGGEPPPLNAHASAVVAIDSVAAASSAMVASGAAAGGSISILKMAVNIKQSKSSGGSKPSSKSAETRSGQGEPKRGTNPGDVHPQTGKLILGEGPSSTLDVMTKSAKSSSTYKVLLESSPHHSPGSGSYISTKSVAPSDAELLLAFEKSIPGKSLDQPSRLGVLYNKVIQFNLSDKLRDITFHYAGHEGGLTSKGRPVPFDQVTIDYYWNNIYKSK